MAKKSNKTEHVLRLITTDGGQDKENDSDNDQENSSSDTPEIAHENAPEVTASIKEPENKELTYETKLKIEIEPEITVKAANPEEATITENTPPQVEENNQNKKPITESVFIEEHRHLVNLAEVLVHEKVEDIMIRMGVCDCSVCKADVLALALNSLPPKYVTTDSGKQYFQLEIYRKQFETDILSALTKACVRVKASPRH
ncbi:MAG: late competence development ComFB family protein [Anaerovoracaceae bacterium]|jgi:competence protein ComFB